MAILRTMSERLREPNTIFKVKLRNELKIETLLRELNEFRAELRGRAGHGDASAASHREERRGLDSSARIPALPPPVPGGLVNYGKLARFRGMP